AWSTCALTIPRSHTHTTRWTVNRRRTFARTARTVWRSARWPGNTYEATGQPLAMTMPTSGAAGDPPPQYREADTP
ncbi:MAG TPA: hypothetical protein VFE42_16790, partial [Chloroflexota bacterium]|nr:hypothetical protein [Chloroflexota bacterium]